MAKIEIRRVLRVHWGQDVRGTAKKYPYFQVSAYAPRLCKTSGEMTLRKVERVAGPFRSQAKCERIAQQIAEEEPSTLYVPGFGSFHGKPIDEV